MKDFSGKIAIVTGGGTGIGRELARQLVAQGCHVAFCDIIEENLAETYELCKAEAAGSARVTALTCDVSDETQVLAFRDAVIEEHQTDHINLLFNNAGVSGGGSFIRSSRAEWERTFNICFGGVYNFTRAFMPLLLRSSEGHIINVSSVNGFRATRANSTPHSAYSTAKFAVKGFSESLINDLRYNAPHIRVSVVMPGHVGSEIAVNIDRIHAADPNKLPKDWSDEEIEQVRNRWEMEGLAKPDMDTDQLRKAIQQFGENFRKAPVTPAQAAEIILEGVKNEEWRILVGEDAKALDRAVRKSPESAYDPGFRKKVMDEMEQ